MFKEKLHKKLVSALEEFKLETPKLLQSQCLSKINAGSDLIGIGPNGSGKSTLIVISTIQKIQRALDDLPKALILVGNKESGLEMNDLFKHLAKNTDLRINCAFEDGDIDKQSIEIYEGTDILIGTAKRILDLYFKRSLNLNKIKLFVIDDAELMIKNSWQGQIDRLALSLPKCQHLVFTNEMDAKIEKLISKFIIAPHLVEVD
ncbi:DEAD/DEAH box helicase [Aurantibacillus circumpalustris]|uniref:DEAD/DEAH box helicase n=1 Tax=Aurantibacillus circumpalustris TaxID=3036359 RepID=UPI00295BEF36|nr:DEAD/DEAH box helicase [Aurantibacillus circumpalustris]